MQQRPQFEKIAKQWNEELNSEHYTQEYNGEILFDKNNFFFDWNESNTLVVIRFLPGYVLPESTVESLSYMLNFKNKIESEDGFIRDRAYFKIPFVSSFDKIPFFTKKLESAEFRLGRVDRLPEQNYR